MKLRVIRPVGACRLDIEIDDRSDKEGLAKALFFTEPDVCGLCDSGKILWSQHKAKAEKDHQTYTFITRICTGCGAESQAGDYQTGGMFWKRWAKPTRRREPQPQE